MIAYYPEAGNVQMSRIPVIGLCEVARFMTARRRTPAAAGSPIDRHCLASALSRRGADIAVGARARVILCSVSAIPTEDESENYCRRRPHGTGADEPFDPFHDGFLRSFRKTPVRRTLNTQFQLEGCRPSPTYIASRYATLESARVAPSFGALPGLLLCGWIAEMDFRLERCESGRIGAISYRLLSG